MPPISSLVGGTFVLRARRHQPSPARSLSGAALSRPLGIAVGAYSGASVLCVVGAEACQPAEWPPAAPVELCQGSGPDVCAPTVRVSSKSRLGSLSASPYNSLSWPIR